jgi:HK97 family phage portal protein
VIKTIKSFIAKTLSVVSPSGGWYSIIKEPFAGAWQSGQDATFDTLIGYSTLYACISRIATDIGKLPFRLKALDSSGIWAVIKNPAYDPVLRKPNHFQTSHQFREAWVVSKLSQGNTYVLKERDARGVVVALYILNPLRVMPLVADNGEVFYQLHEDKLNQIFDGGLVFPASEIIHDRCISPFHPLVGLPPLAGAYTAALKNLNIIKSASKFFGNNAQPGGLLVAPGSISPQTADELKAKWQANFTGDNTGKIAVVGDALKFEPMAMKSVDAQMVEQLRYSDEQICQPFGVPPFKVGIGTIPAGMKVDDINQLYYSDALQTHIESMENLLDQGLGLGDQIGVELDLLPLLRMDATKQAEFEAKLVGGAIKTPNEARLAFGLPPIEGGDSVYLQQQNYSLEALAKRDAKDDPFSKSTTRPLGVETGIPASEELEMTADDIKLLAMFIDKELRYESEAT